MARAPPAALAAYIAASAAWRASSSPAAGTQQYGADAGPDDELPALRPARRVRSGEHPLRERDQLVHGPDVGCQRCELVATEAGQGVVRAQAGSDPLGDVDQQCVAGRVSEPVVDLLEPVEVEEEQSRGPTLDG